MPDDALRYPVGRMPRDIPLTDELVRDALAELAALPVRLADAVTGLVDEQLDTPYRPDGWTVRQVVHHLADSHINAYVRMRLALTADTPSIQLYHEAAWAELSDARGGPVNTSLALLDALHARLVSLLGALDRAQLGAHAYRHPELGAVPLDRALTIYAWHGRHHVAHISALRSRQGW